MRCLATSTKARSSQKAIQAPMLARSRVRKVSYGLSPLESTRRSRFPSEGMEVRETHDLHDPASEEPRKEGPEQTDSCQSSGDGIEDERSREGLDHDPVGSVGEVPDKGKVVAHVDVCASSGGRVADPDEAGNGQVMSAHHKRVIAGRDWPSGV